MSGTTAHPQTAVNPAAARPPAGGHLSHAEDRDLTRLRRMQWAVRAALALGVAASVCANVLHARHDPIAQTIAGWPPLALMLTVELISRVPVHRRALAVVRLLAIACIAGIAAYVSYFHMAAVVSRYGEHRPNSYLLPISVDGLIVVASVSLVELAGRVRAIRDEGPDGHPTEPTPPARPSSLSDSVTMEASLAQPARSNGHAGTAAQQAPPLRTSAWPPFEPSAPVIAAPPPDEPPSIELPADTAVEPDGDPEDALDLELAALLPAARTARDALRRQHRGLTRDSLAAQLRRDGHSIRTSRVSALLNLLRNDEPATVNERSTSASS